MNPIIRHWLTGVIAIFVLGLSALSTEAKLSKNHIAYWRANYPELQPTDDPRVIQARAIFQRIAQVAGGRDGVRPRLYITQRDPWNLTLPIALPGGWVILSKGVLDICYRMPSQGDDRLAFVLAHELAHQLNDDFWHMRFFQAYEAVASQQPAPQAFLSAIHETGSNAAHVMARELQADERGIIYASMAGFAPHAIVSADDSVNFFEEWVRALDPRRVGGMPSGHLHPTPKVRAVTLKRHLRRVADQAAVFQAGLWWHYAGDYPKAIEAFDQFRVLFPSREVIHNLAASHHRLALQLLQLWKPNTAMPFQLAMAIDPHTRASQMYRDEHAEASRGNLTPADAKALFYDHLDQSITLYRRAIGLDKSYIPAARNLASALIVRGVYATDVSRQGDVAEAVMTLSRALQLQPNDPELHTNLGVAWFYQGLRDRAQASFTQARTLAPNAPAPVNNLAHMAHIEQRSADAQAYQRQYQQLTSHFSTRRATGNPSIEQIQEISLGDDIPARWRIRSSSQIQLGGHTYVLAAYDPGIMALTQDGEILMAMAHNGYRGKSGHGIRLGSHKRDVLAAYGTPSQRLSASTKQNWRYDQPGIAFQFKADRVVSWLVFWGLDAEG